MLILSKIEGVHNAAQPSRLVLFYTLYLAIATAAIYAGFSGWAYDDPFITYRYAHNLANGVGFVYNPGEQVLSTTTPFFTLLLALLSPFWADLPRLANLIGALSLSLGGILLWDLAHSWEEPVVGWVSLLLYPTFSLLVTTLGSETPLYLALCLAAFAFYARRRYNWTAVFSALAVLTRPDGVLVPAILVCDYLLRAGLPRLPGWNESYSFHRNASQKWPVQAVLLFLGLLLPWALFAWVYFGSPLPATLAAKQSQGAMLMSQRFASGFWSMAQGYAARWYFWIAAALALAGILYGAWRARRWALFLSWNVLYFTAYTILGVSRYYWYYAPLVPGFIILIGLGAAAVSRLQRFDLQNNRSTRPASILAALLVLAFIAGQADDLLSLQNHMDRRPVIYRAVGEWLAANTPPGATVAALEVGIIGYYAQRPMVDFAGLIQPDIAVRLTPHTTYADAADWAVSHYRPDYLVLQEETFINLEQGYAVQHCRLAQRFPGEHFGYPANLIIYACS